MKKVARRSVLMLILAAILAVGAIAFAVRYCINAEKWTYFQGNPHLYAGTTLACGTVRDSEGVTLLETANGTAYAEDADVRASFVHLLSDRDGNIIAPLISQLSEQMISYNAVSGIYGMQADDTVATLSVNAEIQKTALNALAGRKGTVGVYNYQTGEILCAVSSPAFDPDNPPDIKGDTTGKYDGAYINRFFRSTYTPGSVFKVLTSAAAIEQIDDVYHQKFTCEGSTIIGSQHVICEKEHGETDFSDGFARSCNCVFGQLSVQLGGKTLQKYAEKVGLNASYDCDGYKTAKGSIDLSRADDGDTAWAGIGQYSDQINAYSYMRFMGILGGGGEAAEPYLLKSVTNGEQVRYEAETKLTGRALKEETAQKLATMMHYNVVTIYGAQQFPNLYVCAKSGTAEQEGAASNAMFTGFIKDEVYPLAFVVFIESAGSGSGAAAPVAAQVLHKCVEQMGK